MHTTANILNPEIYLNIKYIKNISKEQDGPTLVKLVSVFLSSPIVKFLFPLEVWLNGPLGPSVDLLMSEYGK